MSGVPDDMYEYLLPGDLLPYWRSFGLPANVVPPARRVITLSTQRLGLYILIIYVGRKALWVCYWIDHVGVATEATFLS